MSARLLVAGVGNIFLADDAFGPEVIRALGRRPLPPEVRVRDFGIRGMDLAYALLDGYDTAVLVDAAVRGQAPGTLSLIEPDLPDRATVGAPPEAHGMDPAKVLALAAHLGDEPLPRVLVLACEPELRACRTTGRSRPCPASRCARTARGSTAIPSTTASTRSPWPAPAVVPGCAWCPPPAAVSARRGTPTPWRRHGRCWPPGGSSPSRASAATTSAKASITTAPASVARTPTSHTGRVERKPGVRDSVKACV